jgi:hypothetical protein
VGPCLALLELGVLDQLLAEEAAGGIGLSNVTGEERLASIALLGAADAGPVGVGRNVAVLCLVALALGGLGNRLALVPAGRVALLSIPQVMKDRCLSRGVSAGKWQRLWGSYAFIILVEGEVLEALVHIALALDLHQAGR